jgi:hypothetical protein
MKPPTRQKIEAMKLQAMRVPIEANDNGGDDAA